MRKIRKRKKKMTDCCEGGGGGHKKAHQQIANIARLAYENGKHTIPAIYFGVSVTFFHAILRF